jgi:hypothetical protein
MDKQVYLQQWRCIQIEGSLEFTSFPAVNAKMRCQEYPNAQDGNPGARSRDQILTLKASNTPPAKFCTLKISRFTNLMYSTCTCESRCMRWSHEIQYFLYDSETNYKCTCTRRNPYCNHAKGWSIKESWFDFPQGHLTLHFPNLARMALESSQTPLYRHKALLSWWQSSRGVQLTTPIQCRK